MEELGENDRPESGTNPKKKRPMGCIILIIVSIYLMYAPPFCFGYQATIRGPREMYSIHSLAARGKLPLVALYVLIDPDQMKKLDEDGDTPLHRAAANARVKTLEYLVSHGADVNAGYPHTPFVDALCSSGDYNTRTWMGFYFIDHGLKINTDGRGWIPLHTAVGSCNMPIITKLIGLGSEINQRDSRGRTPIFQSISCDISSIQYLLDHGADASLKDDNGNTVLQVLALAPFFSDKELELFVKNGADINSQDPEGNTFLHRAVRRGRKQYIYKCLELGADPNIRNNEGKLPVDYAKEGEIKDYLLSHGSSN